MAFFPPSYSLCGKELKFSSATIRWCLIIRENTTPIDYSTCRVKFQVQIPSYLTTVKNRRFPAAHQTRPKPDVIHKEDSSINFGLAAQIRKIREIYWCPKQNGNTIAKLGAELVILGTEEMMHLPVEIELNDKKSLAKKIPSS